MGVFGEIHKQRAKLTETDQKRILDLSHYGWVFISRGRDRLFFRYEKTNHILALWCPR
jgi:hypothetical protein